MNIRTKAALKTLAFLGASFGAAAVFILLGIIFSEKVAMVVLAVSIIGYLSWIMYDHYVKTYEFEQKYSKIK